MKIIHVTQHLGIGGLEKIIYHILLEQISRGHDVSIYVYDYDREWVPFFQKSGIKVITPPFKKSGYDFSLIPRFHHDLFGADIIHSHDMNPMMYLFPIFLFKKLTFQKRPKLIHTTHGLGHIDRVPYYRYFEEFIIPIADKIIGVSEKIGDFYKQELLFSKNKIRVIENGIKTYNGIITNELKIERKKWLCERHGLDFNRPLLLSLSRVVPLKDQMFLMKAIALRENYQLIVVGPNGDHKYFEELKLLETENIKLVGSQELVSEYNIGSDLYVSASTHEGIPVAVLEAMAVETPVLISNIAGHATLNQFGNATNLFELNQTEEFLKKCDLILNQDNSSKTKLARVIVENNFSVKKMVDQYMQEYTK